MKYQYILNEISQLMEIDLNDLNIEQPLDQYGSWDSLVAISTIAMIDQQFNVLLKASELDKCKTLKEIFELVDVKQELMVVDK